MKKVQIKASMPLFEKWKEIVERINKTAALVWASCGPLFDKDKEVELASLVKWRDEIVPGLLAELDARKSDIQKLAEISRTYIKNTQGK